MIRRSLGGLGGALPYPQLPCRCEAQHVVLRSGENCNSAQLRVRGASSVEDLSIARLGRVSCSSRGILIAIVLTTFCGIKGDGQPLASHSHLTALLRNESRQQISSRRLRSR